MDEALLLSERLPREVKSFSFACSERPTIPLTCMDVDDQRQHKRGRNHVVVFHRVFLSFSKPISPEPTLHCSPC